MKVYLDLLKTIKKQGTLKQAAREGMPGTLSLFGYQFRHDLSEGFPLLTTKKLNFKTIVTELLWFLSGDTNIKYLVDNGCNIWNEDAYNYYRKIVDKKNDSKKLDYWEEIKDILYYSEKPSEFEGTSTTAIVPYTYFQFCGILKSTDKDKLPSIPGYTLGDCGMQYGKLWRNWESSNVGNNIYIDTINIPEMSIEETLKMLKEMSKNIGMLPVDTKLEAKSEVKKVIDQIKELIGGLKNNPMSRRHIITAWNPVTLDDMALNACHALVQFNCRPIPWEVKLEMAQRHPNVDMENLAITEAAAGNPNFGPIPQYYLDCQMYQRSADVFLGVPFNIASYALLTHILAGLTNMIPGEFIHTFGDVHIYENHMDQVDLQLTREPLPLPTFELNMPSGREEFEHLILTGGLSPQTLVEGLKEYNSHPTIKGKLSTGLN